MLAETRISSSNVLGLPKNVAACPGEKGQDCWLASQKAHVLQISSAFRCRDLQGMNHVPFNFHDTHVRSPQNFH